jgi:hypothetical protein
MLVFKNKDLNSAQMFKYILFLFILIPTCFGGAPFETPATTEAVQEFRGFVPHEQIDNKKQEVHIDNDAVALLALISDWVNLIGWQADWGLDDPLPAPVRVKITENRYYLHKIAVAICLGHGFTQGIDPRIPLSTDQLRKYKHIVKIIGEQISNLSKTYPMTPEHAYTTAATKAQLQAHINVLQELIFRSEEADAPIFMDEDEKNTLAAIALSVQKPVDDSYTYRDTQEATRLMTEAREDICRNFPQYRRLETEIYTYGQATPATLGITQQVYDQQRATLNAQKDAIHNRDIQPQIDQLNLVQLLVDRMGISEAKARKIFIEGLHMELNHDGTYHD